MNLYTYKNNPYTFISECRMRVEGEWIDAVIYTANYMPYDGDYFVRAKGEFYQLFEQLNP